MMQTYDEPPGENENVHLQSHLDMEFTNNLTVTDLTGEKGTISEKTNIEGAGETDELQYASIDFSVLQQRSNAMLQSKESDYAEIQMKKGDKETEGKMLEKVDQDGVDQNFVAQTKLVGHVPYEDEPVQDGMLVDNMDHNSVGQHEVGRSEVCKAVDQNEVIMDVVAECQTEIEAF